MRALLLADGFVEDAPTQLPGELEPSRPPATVAVAGISPVQRLIHQLAAAGATSIEILVDESPEHWRDALGACPLPWTLIPVARERQGPRRLLAARRGATFAIDARVELSPADLRSARGAFLYDPEGRMLATPLFSPEQPSAPIAWVADPLLDARRPVAAAILRRGMPTPRSWVQVGGGVWTAPGVSVPEDVLARARGPVWIDAAARIERGATLNGPLSVGAGCVVTSGATLSGSVLTDGARVGSVDVADAWLEGDRLWKGPDAWCIRIEDPELLAPSAPPPAAVGDVVVALGERTAASLALAVLTPLLVLVAALIQLDSRGGVLYSKPRVVAPAVDHSSALGYLHRPGDVVPHAVFRTMRPGADQHRTGQVNTYAGGPFKKFIGDTRVTRIGAVLRKASVDELPLLWNVAAGRTRLVGLWSLPADEARALEIGSFPLGGRSLSPVARRRFLGRAGIAGLWQARGRSRLSAEERAVLDSYQAVVFREHRRLRGTAYALYATTLGNVRMVWETLLGVVRARGAM
jgi:lipopolysaccharide/colanic/teichoic acid biosynthesis glycosyltransferase